MRRSCEKVHQQRCFHALERHHPSSTNWQVSGEALERRDGAKLSGGAKRRSVEMKCGKRRKRVSELACQIHKILQENNGRTIVIDVISPAITRLMLFPYFAGRT
jgi:hypothetical protein